MNEELIIKESPLIKKLKFLNEHSVSELFEMLSNDPIIFISSYVSYGDLIEKVCTQSNDSYEVIWKSDDWIKFFETNHIKHHIDVELWSEANTSNRFRFVKKVILDEQFYPSIDLLREIFWVY